MSISKLNLRNFFELPANIPILDVRSPSEYAQAHIPGAISLPLFSDEERKEIGTAYKQQSRETAIRIGLVAFGPRLLRLVDEVLKVTGGDRQIRLHCWRGGMRSGAVAWLLDLYGFKVHLLAGGYKSYRHFVLDTLQQNYHLMVLGGYTGGNKTGLLSALAREGQKVVDLENVAGHKGSAFGNLLQVPQPSQEHFENLLATELLRTGVGSPEAPIWVEAESQRLGLLNIPLHFFNQMRSAPMVFLDASFEARLQHIIKDYGQYDKDKLVNAILRIKKKLGGLETKNAVNALLEDDTEGCFRILLGYYDKLYLKSAKSTAEVQRPVHHVSTTTTDASVNLQKILPYVNSK